MQATVFSFVLGILVVKSHFALPPNPRPLQQCCAPWRSQSLLLSLLHIIVTLHSGPCPISECLRAHTSHSTVNICLLFNCMFTCGDCCGCVWPCLYFFWTFSNASHGSNPMIDLLSLSLPPFRYTTQHYIFYAFGNVFIYLVFVYFLCLSSIILC